MKQKNQFFKTWLILTIILASSINQLKAQDAAYIEKVSYKAYVTNSLALWRTIEKKASERYQDDTDDMQKLFDLATVQYGLLSACIAKQDEKEFNKYLPKAAKNVDTLLKYNSKWAAAHALKAGVLSSEMAFSPAKGMILGPKSNNHIEKAITLDPQEPTGWIQKAGSKLHTPKMFGGSLKEAVKSYEKAVKLYEQDSSNMRENWQYLSAKTWLGIAYTKNEMFDEALQVYKDIMTFEPGFGWVKYDLLPNLKEKRKSQK